MNILILGCGPTLSSISAEKIAALKSEWTIFAIKQAYNIAPGLIDYHFLNDNNYSLYEHKNTKVIVEMPQNHYVQQIASIANELYFVDNTDFKKSLSYTHNFDAWTFENSTIRPWGPGILYELVFYYAYNFRPKRIHTVGWDLGPPGSQNRDHFYNHAVINPAAPLLKDEADREIELSRGFYEWFKSKDVELSVTNGSFAHKDIPRC